jgi:hypothetical protein
MGGGSAKTTFRHFHYATTGLAGKRLRLIPAASKKR